MDDAGVNWDITSIGFGMRAATLEPIVERFEGTLVLRATSASSSALTQSQTS